MTASRTSAALSRFRKLSLATAIVTFLLVIVGGIVRVSESGLGCGPSGSGLHGWPLCGGQVLPVIGNEALFVEFAHRFLAAVVVALIVGMAWIAWRDLREMKWATWGSTTAGILVLMQAGLGGMTVEYNLSEALLAAHLFLAMICFGILIWLAVAARDAEEGAERRRIIPRLRPFSIVAATLLILSMVAGSYMAGTEKLGADGKTDPGAHMACGNQFPDCLDQGPLPFGKNSLIDIHLTHRVLVYLAAIAIIALIAAAWKMGSRSRLIPLALGLLVLQIALGGMNVWLGSHAVLIVAHLATAVGLWTSVLLIGFTQAFAPVPAPLPSSNRRSRTVTA